jgi:protein subunit release factor B
MDAAFHERLRAAGLKPDDFEERFCRASGPGGQNVNKVSTAVEVVHRPSGLRAVAQDGRSQAQNRTLAWERILHRIFDQRKTLALERQQARELKRRQNRKRPAGIKRRMVEGKRRRAAVKSGRRAPGSDD